VNRKFTLAKPGWDSIASELVDQACNTVAKADLAAVVMQEGLAYVCLITPSMTVTQMPIRYAYMPTCVCLCLCLCVTV
jgi:protein pelota